MPPGKGGNAKKEAGRAKKAENEAKKQAVAAAEKERKEAAAWADNDVKGGKATKEAKEEKRKADLARKAENAKLLAEEETNAPPKVKAAPKAGQKKKAEAARPAGPGAIAAGGGLAAVSGGGDKGKGKEPEVESYSATGIDNALELLDVVTAKMDKASLGQEAAGLEKHPERRFKGAFEAYQERELPKIKQDHPGLRLQQYKELLFKQFQKSPENPFNQATVAYDASKEDRLNALNRKRAEIEGRLRD
ncbi:hypothetical protein D9756_008983 [Leucocoprinus leucothites]|uniref:DUF1014-domain-containing protein n=1 Tax=Leucocoprinus leucothites TaxID=201217 RepID=A0A8H5CX50_9AGAR|nr:hypothetical protein D9756_008983 [Leucoagaricus leucothites]